MAPPPSEAPPVHAPALAVERASEISPEDMGALCEAADAAIIEGGGFGWVNPPGRAALERYFRGVLLVPERELFLARLDGVIVGSAQLVRPPRNNEAQGFAAQLMHSFIALYERMGYIRWGIHPVYARVAGRTIRGIYYYKTLQPHGRIA
jgi:hypothetical protein